MTDSVQVSAEGSPLQTESVERSQAIVGKQIENIEIEVNGRNPLDMAKLVPGVVSTANFSVGGVNGIANLFVNCNRGTSNQLTINGIGNIDTGSNGSQNVTVSIDSTAEFKVLTGQYQAEYGRNASAQIALVTKSGTSDFHGSGYIYHRHEDLNADTFINSVRGLPRTLYRYNNPGLSRIYDRRPGAHSPSVNLNEQEGLLFLEPGVAGATESQRPEKCDCSDGAGAAGKFSQSADNNNRPLVIRDPLTENPIPGNTFRQTVFTPAAGAVRGFATGGTIHLLNSSG